MIKFQKKSPLSTFKGSGFRVRRFLKCSLEWVTVSQLRFLTRSCKWERVTNCHQRTWHHRRAPTGSQKSSRTSVINAAVQAIQRIEMRENTRNGSQSSFFQLCYTATFIALGTSFISLMAQKCSPGPQGCIIDGVPLHPKNHLSTVAIIQQVCSMPPVRFELWNIGGLPRSFSGELSRKNLSCALSTGMCLHDSTCACET